jgi:hypothetical protein
VPLGTQPTRPQAKSQAPRARKVLFRRASIARPLPACKTNTRPREAVQCKRPAFVPARSTLTRSALALRVKPLRDKQARNRSAKPVRQQETSPTHPSTRPEAVHLYKPRSGGAALAKPPLWGHGHRHGHVRPTQGKGSNLGEVPPQSPPPPPKSAKQVYPSFTIYIHKPN